MTPEQEAHLIRIKAAFLKEADAKYRAGQREHGGDLFDHTALWLCDQIMAEGLDLYIYGFTLRERLLGMDSYNSISRKSFVEESARNEVADKESTCNCHCGRAFRYSWDEDYPTGKTLREVD